MNAQLTHALESRVIIEQAKGVLAEREGLEIDAAFAMLRDYARDHNLKLADVAEGVVDGTLRAEAIRARRAPRPGSA